MIEELENKNRELTERYRKLKQDNETLSRNLPTVYRIWPYLLELHDNPFEVPNMPWYTSPYKKGHLMNIPELEKKNQELNKLFWTLIKVNEALQNRVEQSKARKMVSPGIYVTERDFSTYVPSITYKVI